MFDNIGNFFSNKKPEDDIKEKRSKIDKVTSISSVQKDIAHLALLKNNWDVDLSITQIFDNFSRYQLNNEADMTLLATSKSALKMDDASPDYMRR